MQVVLFATLPKKN